MAISKEIGMDIDDFNQQKVLNSKESIVQIILNILFMKPGCIPSLPHIGIDVNQYIYAREGEVDASDLKSKLSSQCNDLLPYLITGDIVVKFTDYKNVNILLIGIPITYEGEKETLLIGLSPTDTDFNTNIVYKFDKLI